MNNMMNTNQKVSDMDILMYREEFWKNEQNAKIIKEDLSLIIKDYNKVKCDGILSLEEDFDNCHTGFYAKGLRRVLDGDFDFDLGFEIVEEKNKDVQFLNYFYYSVWNSLKYGTDIYQVFKKFIPDSVHYIKK